MTKTKSKKSGSVQTKKSTKSQSLHKSSTYHKATCLLPNTDRDFITTSLKTKGEIWLPDIGKLIVRKYKPHKKIMNGVQVKVPARNRVSFKLATKLYNELNG